MKYIPSFLSPCLLSVSLLSVPLSAATLEYNDATNPGWFATDAWFDGIDPVTWIPGSSAVLTGPSDTTGLTVDFAGSTTVDNLTTFGNIVLSSATENVLTMNGGTLTTNYTFGLRLNDGVTIQGDFTYNGSGIITFAGISNIQDYVGTATLNEGTFNYQNPGSKLGTDSNHIMNGGKIILWQTSGTVQMGSLVMNDGELEIGRSNTASNSFSTSVTELAGSAGTIYSNAQTGGTAPVDPSVPMIRTLTVNQSTNTTFAGDILGINDNPDPTRRSGRIEFTKSGAGDLILSGELELARVTTVSGGGLFINGANTQFGNEADGPAISVVEGVLGGTGVITVAGNAPVRLGADGQLAAGMLGSAGVTTYNLGSGVLNLALATASANTGWLHFDLGSSAVAGDTYDQIALITGTLDIGSGLSFSDFDFNLLGGFGPGTYTLFDTNASIAGSLGDAIGQLDGYDAELLFVGNNLLVLQVIPEPATWLALGLAAFAVVLIRRRK